VRRITFPLYVGGFLGPFGGAMLTAIIPNVAEGLDTSLTLVGAAITAYMIPFAVLQLVSGTVAERLGARRVVRASTEMNVSFRVTENVFPQSQCHKVAKAVRKNHHHHEQRPLLDK